MSRPALLALWCAGLVLAARPAVQAQVAATLTTLASFDGSNGALSEGQLVQGSDGNFYGTTSAGGANGYGTVFEVTPTGTLTTLHSFSGGDDGSEPQAGLVQGSDGNFYGTTQLSGTNGDGHGTIFKLTVASPPAFFAGETALTDGVYYLAFPNGNPFGYYSFLTDSYYLYHFDLGYEYVFDANDGNAGVYLYDFTSGDCFYTSPAFPFPYLFDFNLNAVLYYYPDPDDAGHYSTNPRIFYDFATRQVITR